MFVCTTEYINSYYFFYTRIYKHTQSVGGTSAHTLTQDAMVDGFK